jgi:hypothetical protein
LIKTETKAHNYNMDYDYYHLKPRYSTGSIPGKCVKCLGEHEVNTCLMQLLREEETDAAVLKKFQALVTFLQSSEAAKLRDESEKYLAEGKKVTVKIAFGNGHTNYDLVIEENNQEVSQ